MPNHDPTEPFRPAPPWGGMARRNNPAELRAFDAVCARLGGFDGRITFEWIDGFLTALAAAPSVPDTDEWLEAMGGDAFDRTFADPADRKQALRALQTRLSVLLDQLDPEALLDAPELIRLDPLMAEWTDADRRRAIDEGLADDTTAARLQTGAEWADGFLSAVAAWPDRWAAPTDDDELAGFWHEALDAIAALRRAAPPAPTGEADAGEPAGPVADRDALIDDAIGAVQDLRVAWLERAETVAPRRVAPQPGRNDPCPCGSGRKYKKCHGAPAAAG